MHGRFSRFPVLLLPVLAATLVASCDTGSPTGPRIVSLAKVSGDDQGAAVGAVVADPLVVRAIDQNGVTVPGMALTWEVVSGGGTFISSSTATDDAGLGQAVFRLGNTLGPQQVSVKVGTQTPILFNLIATAAPASLLRVSSGDDQSGFAGAALANPVVVLVTDQVDNPKAGVPITFTVASGGGSVSQSLVLSNASGLASVTWTLGTTIGVHTLVATSPGLPAVTITATATANAPASITIVSGNGQVGTPGSTLADPIVIRVLDEFGNGVPGVPVVFAAAAGSGTMAPPSALTGADGTAQTNWTLGATGGLKTATATAATLSVDFTAGSTVNYTNIAVGGHHTCAVSDDHVLYCWGYNGEGQLGIGEDAQGSGPVFAFPTPSAATGNLTFQKAVNSIYHGCAMTLAGVGYCWGVNIDGRVGNGGSEPVVNAPVIVSGSHSYRHIDVSRNHTCGVSFADRLFCWGYGLDGQLGNGGRADASAPAEVSLATPGDIRWSEVSAGGLHTCGIALSVSGGETYCWGVNLRGELGIGVFSPDTTFPAVVAGGNSFVRIAAGGEHTCALTAAGEAWCWGDNTFGQLGTGIGGTSNVPVAVAGGQTFESISAGLYHTCAVSGVPPFPGSPPQGGTVFCWGRNSQPSTGGAQRGGQIGDGSITHRGFPTPVASGEAFFQVSAGDRSSCGITINLLAYCWGDNQFGQLGDGTLIERRAPTKVAFQP